MVLHHRWRTQITGVIFRAMSREREQVYDSQMAPLVAELVRLATEHGIPMVTSFELSAPHKKQTLFCTNASLPLDSHRHLRACFELVASEPRAFLHEPGEIAAIARRRRRRRTITKA